MRKLSIIGIGAGNPDHLTVQAIKALSDIDVVFLIDKGSEKDALAQLRREICERHIKKPYRIVQAKDPERDPHRPDRLGRFHLAKPDA
jgi:precorrin-6A synthase